MSSAHYSETVNSFLLPASYDLAEEEDNNGTHPGNGSSLSSFEEFCGNSPFWDTDLLIDSSYPRFTECFRQIAVVWIPCLTYIAVCLPYLVYLSLKPPVPPSRIGFVGIAKTLCCICLLGITIATIIVRAVDDDQDDITDALYVSEGIKAVAFCLSILVSFSERRKGVVASAVSWIFWLSLTTLNIIPFYTNFKEDKQDDDRFGFIIFIFYFFFVILALILASFVEHRRATYQDISNQNDQIECPMITASIPSRVIFWWMTKLVILGFKKTLEESDVFEPTSGETLATIMPQFEKTWNKQKEKVDKYNAAVRASQKPATTVHFDAVNERSPLIPNGGNKKEEVKEKSPYKKISVFKVIMADHGLTLIIALVVKAGFDCFMFLTPKITEALLDYITYREQYYEWRGYTLAVSYLFVNALSSAVSNQCIFFAQRSGIRMKAALVNAIYRKSLTCASIGDSSTKGEVNNLMSVSTEKVLEVSHYIHFLISAPAQLVIATVLLYEQLGVAVFAGLGVMVLTLPINGMCGYLYEKWQKRMMEYKDQRSSLLSEIFNGIKVLKLYAWEASFQEKIKSIRDQELKNIIHIQYVVAVVSYFFQALPSLIQVTAFGVHINREGYLDPTVCFVSLQLFNMLNTPLLVMPLIIPGLIQAMVAVNRISAYLNKPDIKTDSITRDSNAVNAVEIQDGSFTWTLDEQQDPTLRNINMQVAPGSLVAVVGTVGCGKSSLISAMLGEMEKLSGEVVVKGTVAYVPQEAWIQNATLRANITFGKEHRVTQYDKIVEACALKADLDILPGGDMTEIGEKGINISGGQKQRVSLARAVYSDRDIFLMDDPLSAVDSHVGKHIFEEVIGEAGVLKQKTRILVTHGIHWLPMVDKIFVMAQGQIREAGTYEELIGKDGDFARFIREYAQDGGNQDDPEDVLLGSLDDDQRSLTGSIHSTGSLEHVRPQLARRQSSILSTSMTSSKQHRSVRNEKKPEKVGAKLTDDEIGMTGRVQMSTYAYYFKQVGFQTCLAALFFYSLNAGGNVFAAIWLTEWTGDEYLLNRTNKDTDRYDDDTQEYLGVYAGASIVSGFFVYVFYMIAAVRLTAAARVLHSNMLSNVLRAPMSFFDTTPIGRILNRFSLDVEVMDQTLPMSINQILSVFSLVIVTIVNICYGTPEFLGAMVPLGIIYIAVQSLYIPTCRQLRRIESISRSPIYVHFSETLDGADSIRAYGCQDRFIDESVKKVDHNIKFYFAGVSAFCWLTVWLNFLGNMVIFLAAIFAVAASDIDPSIVGLSVSYASSMTEALGELVNGISEAETNIVSVERIKEYSVTQQEAPWTLPNSAPRPDWPETGNIVLDNYQTRYRPGLDLVLKNITCTIKGGEKIGIVGRTGAGKSSMTVALFRIIEAAGGRIVIDGEDVSKMGLHDLRSKLTILPQEPVIFCGSMRSNLDPFDKYTEPELWNALEHSYLKEFVEGLPGRLDYECGEEGSNLSVGQRQLVCLARTLLRKTKILVLDEATAAVDMETDDLIQQTIRREFKDCTILTIAHRLNTIIDYDRVMVLDQGQIKEFDSPTVLLADDKTIFYGMAKGAGLV